MCFIFVRWRRGRYCKQGGTHDSSLTNWVEENAMASGPQIFLFSIIYCYIYMFFFFFCMEVSCKSFDPGVRKMA